MAADLAQALGVPYCFVEVRCSPEIARERLAHRQAEGTDPSDAEAEFHATSVARFEPVTGEGHLEVIRTDAEGWRAAVRELSGRMRTSRRHGGLDPSTP
jgi:predicted kinase